jgi:methyl-accepting chemotaxis protein
MAAKDTMARPASTDNLRRALTDAFGDIQGELTRAKSLVAEASSNLIESFQGMKGQIQAQQASLDQAAEHLLSRTREAGAEDGRSFSDAMGLLVQRFVDELVRVSLDSMKLVERFDMLASHVDGIVSRVNGIDRLARQTRFVALNANIEARRVGKAGLTFMVVAEEVKHLADSSARMNDQIREVVSGARVSMDEARGTINQLASHDMSVALESKNRMTEAMKAFEDINATATETLKNVSMHVSKAITSLQFEDLITQLLTATTHKVEVLGVICLEILARLDAGHPLDPETISMSEAHLRELGAKVAVKQQTLNHGEAELF